MERIGFYTEDELMDLLQEGAIDMVDFLRYSPQWHDYFGDFCYSRCLRQDNCSAALFMNHMELEEIAGYNYYFDDDDYDLDFPGLVDAVNEITDFNDFDDFNNPNYLD